jgi:hypothetical protein
MLWFARKILLVLIVNSVMAVLEPQSISAQESDMGEQDFSRIPGYELFGQQGSFFFLHMYTDLTYWDYQSDHLMPLQFHSAQDDSAQFSNSFTALFIGSEINDRITFMSQIHFHLNPIPGQVGPTVVIPQAKISWSPLGTNNLRLHFGRFYSPFGIANDDVQTPLNRFVSQPYTGFTAIPFHWFDTGIQLDLAGGLTQSIGGNLAVAFINGPQRIVPDVPPNFQELDDRILFPPSAPGGALLKTSYTDLGDNLAIHMEIFPGAQNLILGGSYALGELRHEPLLIPDDDGPGVPPGSRTLTGQYPANWHAVGADLQFYFMRVSIRGDWTRSTEELKGSNAAGVSPPFKQVKREAWRAQIALQVLRNHETAVKNAWLTARVDQRDPDKSVNDSSDQRRYTLGMNLSPVEQVLFKANYEWVEELHGAHLNNNGVLLQVVAYF